MLCYLALGMVAEKGQWFSLPNNIGSDDEAISFARKRIDNPIRIDDDGMGGPIWPIEAKTGERFDWCHPEAPATPLQDC